MNGGTWLGARVEDWYVAAILVVVVTIVAWVGGADARRAVRESEERDRYFARLPRCPDCGLKYDPAVGPHDCEAA